MTNHSEKYSRHEQDYWDKRGVDEYISLSEYDQGRIFDWINWQGNGSVLDLGGGSGMISRLLIHKRETFCVCVDISFNMLTHAPVSAVQADAFRLPFRDESFDLIVAAAFFHHIPGKEESLLLECHRILKHGGKLVGYDPNAHCIQNRLFMTNGPLRLKFFSPEEQPIVPEIFAKKSRKASFSDFSCEMFTFRNRKITLFEAIQRYLINPFSIGSFKKYLERWFFWSVKKQNAIRLPKQ